MKMSEVPEVNVSELYFNLIKDKNGTKAVIIVCSYPYANHSHANTVDSTSGIISSSAPLGGGRDNPMIVSAFLTSVFYSLIISVETSSGEAMNLFLTVNVGR